MSRKLAEELKISRNLENLLDRGVKDFGTKFYVKQITEQVSSEVLRKKVKNIETSTKTDDFLGKKRSLFHTKNATKSKNYRRNKNLLSISTPKGDRNSIRASIWGVRIAFSTL